MQDIESVILSLLSESASKLKETFDFDTIPQISLEIPRESKFGDLASNVALQIGRQIRHPAKELAHIMRDQMMGAIKKAPYSDVVKRIEVGAPGFINFYLKEESLYYILDKIKGDGDNFGRLDLGKGTKLNIEFASANPTGPLTIAHGRQAAFGDSLANILEFSGYDVNREYYLNDEGRQINMLGASIQSEYLKLHNEAAEIPEDGYRGEYIQDIAKAIENEYKDGKKTAPVEFFADYGYKAILDGIKDDLAHFGVKFDTYFSQRELTSSGKIEKALALLKKKGLLYERDGASWVKSSEFGDEKDRVIIKSDKSYTYFCPDIAYHIDKYARGHDKLIDIWGPDHHGYIPRMKAAMAGLGHDETTLATLIVQLVTLYRGKTQVRMSTRAGSFITLKEVVEEIGKDAARYFFLRRKRDSHLDFDLELAKKHTPDNPVYYIQYAHARIWSIVDFEKKESKDTKGVKPDLNLLKETEEFRILRELRAFPLAVRAAADTYEPFRILHYLEELAKAFHSFYNKHRVVSPDPALTATRLLLVECVKITIANGLRLIGLSAPTQM